MEYYAENWDVYAEINLSDSSIVFGESLCKRLNDLPFFSYGNVRGHDELVL